MSQSLTDSPASLSGLFALALVATGMLTEARTPTPERPGSTAVTVRVRPDGLQRVPARLWEDPLAACTTAARAARTASGSSASTELPGAMTPQRLRDAWDEADRGKPERRTFLFSLTPDLGREEDAETRRRTRYAVLSALHTAGFRASNPDSLGYFKFGDSIVAFEEFRRADDITVGNRTLPAGPLVTFWLPEPELRTGLCKRLFQLSMDLTPPSSYSERRHPIIRVVGPDSSFALKRLKESAESWLEKLQAEEFATDFYNPTVPYHPAREAWLASRPKFFCGTATLDDRRLGIFDADKRSPEEPRSPWETFGSSLLDQDAPIAIYRTTINDQRVLDALVTELSQRDLDLNSLCSGEQRVLIVSPLDDQYGERMADQFRDSVRIQLGLAADDARIGQLEAHVKHYTYMRGLDGIQPREGSGESNPSPQNAKDAASLAHGGRQFDYVARLGHRIRREYINGRKIVAVGVLGSDTYDRLNVLQALRGQFPHALFFTTDLDARLTDPKHFHSTRNLIVGSAFGLELAPELQSDHPPMRDNYSTARYFTALCALDYVRFADSNTPEQASPSRERETRGGAFQLSSASGPAESSASARQPPTIPNWRSVGSERTPWDPQEPLAPRLFEIGRRGAFPLNVREVPDRTTNSPAPIHSDPDRSRTWIRASPIRYLVLPLLAVGVVLLAVAYRSRYLPTVGDRSRFERGAEYVQWGGLAMAVVAFLRADHESVHSWGEPWAIFDGVSVWPSVLIAIVGITVAGKAICLTLHELLDVRTRIEQQFGLDHSANPSNRQPPASDAQSPDDSAQASQLWQAYCESTDLRRTLLVALYLTAAFLAVAGTLWFAEGRALTPTRSESSWWIHRTVFSVAGCTLTYLIALQWHWAAACRRIATQLESKTWEWPNGTPAREPLSDKTDTLAANEYLEVRFFADLSDAAGSVASYPFAILLVLACARSTVFDYWPWTSSDFLLAGVLAGSVLGSWWLLRSRAEALRDNSLTKLQAGYLAAVNQSGATRKLTDHLRQMLDEVRDTQRGAFAPLASNPAVRALYLPVGGLSGLAAIDSFSLLV